MEHTKGMHDLDQHETQVYDRDFLDEWRSWAIRGGEITPRPDVSVELEKRLLGRIDDPRIAADMAYATKGLLGQEAKRVEAELSRIDAIKETDANRKRLAVIREQIIRSHPSAERLSNDPRVINVGREAVTGLYREKFEKELEARLAAEECLWSVYRSEHSEGAREVLRSSYERFFDSEREADPNDVYTVHSPMENGDRGYSEGDRMLLAAAGLDVSQRRFTRAKLQTAGIFFVNRIGAGEQPIFGRNIPEIDSLADYFYTAGSTFAMTPPDISGYLVDSADEQGIVVVIDGDNTIRFIYAATNAGAVDDDSTSEGAGAGDDASGNSGDVDGGTGVLGAAPDSGVGSGYAPLLLAGGVSLLLVGGIVVVARRMASKRK